MIAEMLNLSRAEVHGVVTFYHDFRQAPAGRHVLKMCRAEACQAAGGGPRPRSPSRRLGIKTGVTTADGRSHPGGRLLPGPLRGGALGDARRPGGCTARRRRGWMRCSRRRDR